MLKIFKTNFSEVVLFEDKNEGGELKKYFSNGSLGENIFINDVIFIEENKTKFNRELILKEIDRDSMLILPILNTE